MASVGMQYFFFFTFILHRRFAFTGENDRCVISNLRYAVVDYLFKLEKCLYFKTFSSRLMEVVVLMTGCDSVTLLIMLC